MINIIYEFILNNLIGETDIPNVENLAQLLTFASIIFIFIALLIFIRWFFSIFKSRRY